MNFASTMLHGRDSSSQLNWFHLKLENVEPQDDKEIVEQFPGFTIVAADGSGSRSKEGCGVGIAVSQYLRGELEFSKVLCYKLPEGSKSSDAELHGLLGACRFAAKSGKKCLIVTDSLSQLEYIQELHKRSEPEPKNEIEHAILCECLDLLITMGSNVDVRWVKSHKRKEKISCNEAADKAAREGKRLRTGCFVLHSIASGKMNKIAKWKPKQFIQMEKANLEGESDLMELGLISSGKYRALAAKLIEPVV